MVLPVWQQACRMSLQTAGQPAECPSCKSETCMASLNKHRANLGDGTGGLNLLRLQTTRAAQGAAPLDLQLAQCTAAQWRGCCCCCWRAVLLAGWHWRGALWHGHAVHDICSPARVQQLHAHAPPSPARHIVASVMQRRFSFAPVRHTLDLARLARFRLVHMAWRNGACIHPRRSNCSWEHAHSCSLGCMLAFGFPW